LAPISRHADRERTSTYTVKRLGCQLKRLGNLIGVGGIRPDRHDAVRAKPRKAAKRLGEALGLLRGASEALGRRNVDLQQDGQNLAQALRRLRKRRSRLDAVDALHHIEELRHGLGLVRLEMTDEVLADRRQLRELRLGLLEVVFRDVRETRIDRRANRLGRLLLADADDRDAPGGPSAGAQLVVDELPDCLKLCAYDVDGLRSGSTATSVRGPGRVAQYAIPMMPIAIIGNA